MAVRRIRSVRRLRWLSCGTNRTLEAGRLHVRATLSSVRPFRSGRKTIPDCRQFGNGAWEHCTKGVLVMPKRSFSFGRLAAALAMAGAFAVPTQAPLSAQILYGSIVGNVTDATGAVIPGAQITVVNEGTGAERSGETNVSGVFSFSTVATGSYRIEVRSEGFNTHTETGVAVGVNDVTRVDVDLQVGEVTEVVEVSATAARLQTDRAEVRAEVGTQELQNVPVPLGRNYQMLLQTLPGFSPPRNAHSVPANPTRAVRFSVNGTNEQTNNVRIDGASSYNPNLTHMTGINPALESIEVVNVVTSSFDAEQGLAGGAAINLQIKSGTNDVRGSAFWYHNSQRLQAYPYFSDRGNAKPKFIYNQAGGTTRGADQAQQGLLLRELRTHGRALERQPLHQGAHRRDAGRELFGFAAADFRSALDRHRQRGRAHPVRQQHNSGMAHRAGQPDPGRRSGLELA